MFHTVRAQPTYVELHYRPCDWTSPPPGHCSRPGRPSDSTRIPVLMFRVITFTASALFPLLPSPPLLLLKVNYFHWQNLLQYTSLVSSVNVQAILGTQQKAAATIYRMRIDMNSPVGHVPIHLHLCSKEVFPKSLCDFIFPCHTTHLIHHTSRWGFSFYFRLGFNFLFHLDSFPSPLFCL